MQCRQPSWRASEYIDTCNILPIRKWPISKPAVPGISNLKPKLNFPWETLIKTVMLLQLCSDWLHAFPDVSVFLLLHGRQSGLAGLFHSRPSTQRLLIHQNHHHIHRPSGQARQLPVNIRRCSPASLGLLESRSSTVGKRTSSLRGTNKDAPHKGPQPPFSPYHRHHVQPPVNLRAA